MLPAPARDAARETIARVKRLADSARTRRLDLLEALWKGAAWDERPSFWDKSVPLNERGTCVQSGIAESSGGRVVNLVFGNSRFPSLSVDASARGIAFTEDESAAIDQCVAALVKAAHLRTTMRATLEQGLMCGTLVAVLGVSCGTLTVQLLPAKRCERTLDDDGNVASLEYRYRYEGTDERGAPATMWHRRVIDAAGDTTWTAVPADPAGWLPEWEMFPSRTIAHGLGFCPALWHRNRPDVSDTDPIDGTAMFAGLEDEIFALDMAMSQRHRNGRYNGEPQIVQIGFGENDELGPQGRGAAVMPSLGKDGSDRGSWFSRAYDSAGKFLGFGGSATKKAPGTIWKAPPGGDVKMVESSGAGAQILAADIEGLRGAILEARSIVIASPETLSANASAALLRQVFEPMIGQADNYRDEYGDVLCEFVNMLLRLAVTCARRGQSVYLGGLAEALQPLLRCMSGAAWVPLQFSLAWGEYFEPTWGDVSNAITAARLGNGDEPVLTLEQSVRLVAPVIGVSDIERYLGELTGSNGANRDAAHALLGDVLGPATAPTETVVADTAMNGAQVSSLQAIVEAAAAGTVPATTAAEMIALAFPAIQRPRIDAMLAPIAATAGIAAQHAKLQTEHASALRSIASLKATVKRIMAASGITNITDTGGDAADAIVTELVGPDGDIATDDSPAPKSATQVP